MLAQKYGGKYVMALGIFISAILSIMTPVCVSYGGAPSMIAIRILMGFSQGPIIPAWFALCAAWVPVKERGTIVSVTHGGTTVNRLPFDFT